MSKKISEIKVRLRQYVDYKGFSKREFHDKINVSESFLKSNGGFNVDFLPAIRQNCLDLNLEWLIFNEGKMIKSNDKEYDFNNEIGTVSERELEYNSFKEKYYDLLEENRELNKKLVKCIESKLK